MCGVLFNIARHAVEPARHARLFERPGDLRYVAGIDYEAGITHLEHALQLYQQLGQPDRVAHVHSRLGSTLSALPESWDLPRAVEHYRLAETILAQGPASSALGHVYAGPAQVAIWDVRIRDGLEASAKALELAERLGDEVLWAHAAMAHGSHLFSSGWPWQPAYHYFRLWRMDGTWQHLNAVLREQLRVRIGLNPEPSAAIINSQSVRTPMAVFP